MRILGLGCLTPRPMGGSSEPLGDRVGNLRGFYFYKPYLRLLYISAPFVTLIINQYTQLSLPTFIPKGRTSSLLPIHKFWLKINPVTFEINLKKATSCLRPVFFPCYGCPKYTSNIIFCWTKLAPIYQYICAWEFTNHNLFFHMLRYRNLAVKSKII